VFPENNSIIITDLPDNMSRMQDLVESLDRPVPQVLIEVHLMETTETAAKKLGIEYGAVDGTLAQLQGNSRAIAFPFSEGQGFFPKNFTDASLTLTGAAGYNDTLGISYGLLSFSQFTAVLRMLETSGEGQFLAKPKIMTLNNRMAEIDITANTTVNLKISNLVSSGGNIGQQSKDPERVETGIVLKVVPQINEGGMITMALQPTVVRTTISNFDDVYDPQIRSIATSVRVKDGQTLMIGGLMSTEESKSTRKVPFFGNLPIIGALFTSVSNQSSKKELMIFITPRIVKTF